MSSSTEKIEIIRLQGETCETIEDEVTVEKPFTIHVNEEEFITLLCSGEGVEHLMVGFLASEGLIGSIEDILSIRIEHEEGRGYIEVSEGVLTKKKAHGKRTLTSGCGKGTVFYDVLDSLTAKPLNASFKIDSGKILELSKQFNDESVVFKTTGGVHACALCDEREMLLFHEDIGRHNALDKVIGNALQNKLKIQGKWLLTSGRISSEILIKAAKQGIAMIVSRSAPTKLAIQLAEQMNVTMVGFARGKRMNIYSGAERISCPCKE